MISLIKSLTQPSLVSNINARLLIVTFLKILSRTSSDVSSTNKVIEPSSWFVMSKLDALKPINL